MESLPIPVSHAQLDRLEPIGLIYTGYKRANSLGPANSHWTQQQVMCSV